MSWKLMFRRIWRGLWAFASVFSVGRLFSGVLDMLDHLAAGRVLPMIELRRALTV